MKTIGIISEYNPFHNGHRYHIEAAREEFGADNIVCIMSGSFVQRGEPAIFDKWSRAKMALQGGADLVIELPFVYACQPAEIFAFGAVNILNNLGIIDGICFGSELGNAAALKKVASLLRNEPTDFSRLVKQHLAEGNTYPRSVSMALGNYYQGNESLDSSIWENPNNILGIEYMKAIMQLNSPMDAYTIKRVANNYNDTEIQSSIASATAVRRELQQAGLSEKLESALPYASHSIIQQLMEQGKGPVYMQNLSDIMLYRLRTMSTEDLQQYLSMNEGVEHRVKKAATDNGSMEALIEGIKTKRYTRAFIQRMLCHILLDLKWEQTRLFKEPGMSSYCRVLGFNDKGKYLIKTVKKRTELPIINKVGAFKTSDPLLEKMFQFDLRATDVYNLAQPNCQFKKAGEDFYVSPIYI